MIGQKAHLDTRETVSGTFPKGTTLEAAQRVSFTTSPITARCLTQPSTLQLPNSFTLSSTSAPFPLLIYRELFDMAILTSRPDITVTIEVNNQALKEYVDTTGEGNANQRSSQVTKYIESVPGAEFATRIRLPNKFVSKAKYDLLVRIKLDGQTVVSRVYQKHELHDYVQDGILKDSCTMRDGAGWCSRMFTFTQLQTGKYNAHT